MKKKLLFLFVLVLSGCKEDVEKIEFKEKLSFENYSNKESWPIDSKFFMNLSQDYFLIQGVLKMKRIIM